ncbi:hypothetical protein IJH74_02280 [Candidatus Saccharibacteria bacterium]|nr:hypothetical protein [Candidatus Saccharibacteria bacterium]
MGTIEQANETALPSEINKSISCIKKYIITGDVDQAEKTCQKLLGKYPHASESIKNNFAAICIDCSGSPETAKKGIKICEKLIESNKASSISKAQIRYNLANGYFRLIDQNFKDSKTYFSATTHEYIKKAINNFQKSYILQPSPNIATNLANLYDAIGRPLDAIIWYNKALSLDPYFGMALGNKAIAMNTLSPFSKNVGSYKAYAYKLLDEALKYSESIDRQSDNAVHFFSSYKEKLSRQFSASNFDPQKRANSETSKEISPYTQFCLDNDLYLSLHTFGERSEESIGDTVSFGPMKEIGTEFIEEIFFRLDEIKESYATGRYLLWLSQQERLELDEVSAQTNFLGTATYEDQNLHTGLLKTAYSRAFSSLDKIANIINYYLGLEISEEDINYRKIWGNSREYYHPKIRKAHYHLYGLYSILMELGQQPSVFRNHIEHRYYKLYTPPKHPTSQDLAKDTINALHTIKFAIIYLLLFLSSEEKRQ